MRTFKLKKTYPGCMFKVGDIQKVELSTYAYYENYPDNWQEVIDKEYEIVAFEIGHCGWKITDNNCVYYQMGTGYKSTYPVSHITTMLEYNNNNKNFKIIAIKRLLDGEIFSVGDKITYSIKKEGKDIRADKEFELTSFKLNCGSFGLNSKDTDAPGGVCNLKHAIKVIKKEPFFITEDGVEIQSGTRIYWLTKDESYTRYNNLFEGPFVEAHISMIEDYKDKYDYKVFSTAQSRQEWLDKMYPKPILTTVEGKECFEGDKVFILYRESKERPYKLISNQPITVNKAFKRPTENHLDFSTLEAANQYLIENTTLFSLKDIREVQIHTNPSFLMQDLREEAKKKLNIK